MISVQTMSSSLFKAAAADWMNLSNSYKWLYGLYTLLLVNQLLPLFRALEIRVGLSFMADYSDAIILTIVILGCCSVIFKSIKQIDIIFIAFVALWHYISSIIYPQTLAFSIDNASRFYLSCLPMFFVGLTFRSNTSTSLFVLMSYLAIIFQVVFLGVAGMGVDEEGNIVDEMMSVAYALLPFILFLLWYAFERGGVFNYLISIIGVFILLSLGTRGPVICLMSFVAFYFLFYKHYKRNFLVKSVIVLVASVMLIFINDIALGLSQMASSLGLSTRVFESVIEGQMTDIQQSNGRDEIWIETLNYLTNNKVFFGEGLYSDHLINSSTGYSHNLELELLCSFGLIGGVLVIILLATYVYRAFAKAKLTNGSIILLVFFCSSIIQLQLSGSFLRSQLFWLFLGMCAAMQRINQRKLNQRTSYGG